MTSKLKDIDNYSDNHQIIYYYQHYDSGSYIFPKVTTYKVMKLKL